MKVLRELGLKRCETVWFLSVVCLRELRKSIVSTRGALSFNL